MHHSKKATEWVEEHKNRDRINFPVFSVFQWNSHIHIWYCAYGYSTGNFCNQGYLRTFLCNWVIMSNPVYTNYSAKPKKQIRLFHLPPYSPEYNPDEYLNNDLKRNLGTQTIVKDVQELVSNTTQFMSQVSSDPEHVKAYFDHPVLHSYKLS